MDSVVELVSNLIQSVILTMFISGFFGCKFSGFKKYFGYVLNTSIIFVLTSFINKIVVYDGFFAAIVILTNIMYASIFLKGKFYAHVFASVSSMCFIFSLGSTVIFTMSYITKSEVFSLIADFNFHRLLMHIVCRLAEFIAFNSVIRVNKEYLLSYKEWVIFTVVSAIIWVTITFMTKSAMKAPDITDYMFYCIISMLAINVLIYYFIVKANNDAKAKLDLRLLRIQYDNAKKTQIDMKALYDNTYALKHDLEKHFIAIGSMAKLGKNTEICDYVENVIHTNLRNVQKLVFTDNDILNAVLNTKLEICKQSDINTLINVSGNSVSFLSGEDVVVLFGNLLDNAIEATSYCHEKIIMLSVCQYFDYVSICIENSYDNQYSDINLKTTKINKSEHGYGTKTIKKIVSKYNGSIKFFENDSGMFCCDILLPSKI